MPFAAAAMAYASLGGSIQREITPLVPALQSNWLIAHVVTCFIGYAAFAVAGVSGSHVPGAFPGAKERAGTAWRAA